MYKFDLIIFFAAFYLLIVASQKIPRWKDSIWFKILISVYFAVAGFLLLPESNLSRLVWLFITCSYSSFLFFIFNRDHASQFLKIKGLFGLWFAWLASYFCVVLPYASYRWILGLCSILLVMWAAPNDFMSGRLFYRHKSRLMIACFVGIAAVCWLPFVNSDWELWLRYGETEEIYGLQNIAFLSSWFFISSFSWFIWPFTFSWGESLSKLSSGISALLLSLHVPLSLSCMAVLPMLCEHFPNLYKLAVLGLLLSACYTLLRSLIFIHYKKYVVFIYCAMSCLVLAGSLIKLFDSQANLYNQFSILVFQQFLLYICLLAALSLERSDPIERHMFSELKSQKSTMILMVSRLAIYGLFLNGLAGLLFSLHGVFKAELWNVVLIACGFFAVALLLRTFSRLSYFYR